MIVSPASLTVTQNQTATFYCSADGNPKPSVSWSKTSGTGQWNNSGQDNKLQIKRAGYNDSGSYVCTATNVFGQAKKVVKLFVEGKHKISLASLGRMPRKTSSVGHSSFVIKKTIFFNPRRNSIVGPNDDIQVHACKGGLNVLGSI